LLYSSFSHLDLHSFPTRRSSDLHKLFDWISFNVEFGFNHIFQIPCILISDMSFVRSRVNGDSFCSEFLGFDCSFYNAWSVASSRSEEHTSELQSRENLVCRLLLE